MSTRNSRRDDVGDDGFTMMEILVAMAVFTVTMTVALGLIVNTTGVLRSNTQRVAAANLATQQIEAARSMRALDVPDGASTRTEVVGGTTYTVTQDADFVVAGADVSACLGTGDQLSYKLVTVTVEWPGMAPVQPVRSDTLLALGVGDDDLDETRGSLAIGVSDDTSAPISGARVSLNTGATRTTGADGCVVFTDLAPGNYEATVDTTGLVSTENQQVITSSVTVGAGRVARTTLTLDEERQARIVYSAPTGHTIPSGVDLRYRNSYVDAGAPLPMCTGSGTACLVESPLTARYLFPEVYDFWAGACLDARPTPVSAGASVDLGSEGAAPTVQVPLAGVQVLARGEDSYLTGVAVTAKHAPEGATGCTSGDSYNLPSTTSGTAGSRGALPYGTWTISACGAQQQVTLTPGISARQVVFSCDDD